MFASRSFPRPTAWRALVLGWIIYALASIPAALGASIAGQLKAPPIPPEQQVIQVATKPLTPFVMLDGAKPQGFSIDLWNEVAERNNWQTKWVQLDSVDEVLASVEAGNAQAGIAGISVTAEREADLDFSHAMFDSGLQILVSSEQEGSMARAADLLLSGPLPKFLLALLGILFLSGHVVWLAMRRDGRAPSSYLPGVGYGMWVAGATALAGDVETPRKWLGRIVAMTWILVGVVFVSLFTASVTTQLTVNQFTSDIRSVQDLPGKRVVTVAGSTSDKYLTEIGIDHSTVTAIEDAYPELRAGKADAVVYDAPVLKHWVNTLGKGREQLAGPIFNNEAYGIAFPPKSPILEKVNRTLLEIRADGTYQRLYERWFGAVG